MAQPRRYSHVDRILRVDKLAREGRLIENAARSSLFIEELDARIASGGTLSDSEARAYSTWADLRDRPLRALNAHSMRPVLRSLPGASAAPHMAEPTHL